MKKNIYNMIVNERNNYSSMIDYCCNAQLILNNSIIEIEIDNWEVLAGSIYDDEREEYEEIYQYYIITESAAFKMIDLTNETILYNSRLDIYLLAVKHFGTAWDIVPANWKAFEEIKEY